MAQRRRVAMTGFAGLDNPEPGLAAARALRAHWKRGLDIEALVYAPWSTGGWTPGVADRLHLIPPLAHGDLAVLQRLLAIHRRHPLDALIPCLDLEVPVYSRLATRLARAGIRTLLPQPEDIAAVTKVNLHGFCYANQILTPHTVYVSDLAAVPLHADLLGYPLWVKGTVAGAKKVYNREQAVFEAEPLAARWGGGVLLQEAIEGSEHLAAMVAREDGSCLAMATARKLYCNERGKGVIGAIVDDPGLHKLALQILPKLHWRGPHELEFVRSAKSGLYYLLEINCRLPSWIYLSEFAGANLPAALLAEILAPGRRALRAPRVGAMYARDVEEFTVPVAALTELKRSGEAAVPVSMPRRTCRGDLAVAVSGITSLELTQPGLGVARCLRRAPEVSRVIGLAYTPNDTGLFRSADFDVCSRLPLPGDDADSTAQDEATFDALLRVKQRHGLDVVIPNLDLEIARFRRLAPELDRVGIRSLLPDAAARQKLSKLGLSHLAAGKRLGGLGFPETAVVRSKRDLEQVWKRFGAPMVLKGLEARATRVYSRDQALTIWSRFREDGEKVMLAQPLLYGEEYGVSLVCDRRGRMIDALPLKKLVMCERGKTWGALATPLPLLLDQLAELLGRIGWRGPADVELIRDSLTDRMELIEINPRFPAWIGYAALIEVNLPRDLVLAAVDRPAAAPASWRTDFGGLVFMRTAEEIPAAASRMAVFVNRGELVNGRR